MAGESATLKQASGARARAETRPQLWFRLRLTARERRLMLVGGDLILINASLIAAVALWTRFNLSTVMLAGFYKWFITLTVIWLGMAAILDLYNLARAASTSTIAGSAGLAAALTVVIYTFIPWLTPPIENRTYVFGFVALTAVTVMAWRVLYAQALAQPGFYRRTLVLGTGERARTLLGSPQAVDAGRPANPFRGTGYYVAGFVALEAAGEGDDCRTEPNTLGDYRGLVALARRYDIDEIVAAPEPGCGMAPEVCEVLLDCREVGLQVSSLAAVEERLGARLPVAYAYNDPSVILDSADNAGTRLYQAAKRLLDLACAVVGVLLMAMLAPFVALANALASPGPLFYRQERVGRGSCPFIAIKFRSMRVDAEAGSGAIWSGDGDARVTPVGRWLRRLRFDELPQFVNVLRGEMSVVGPRPERPQFVGELAQEIPLYRARHAVKPGITGWAQTHYGYGCSVEDARIKLEYDLYYIKHASLYLDLMIILRTIAISLQCDGK